MIRPNIIKHRELPGGGPLGDGPGAGVVTRRKWRMYVLDHEQELPPGVIQLNRCRYAIVSGKLPTKSWMEFRTWQEVVDGWSRLCRCDATPECWGRVDGLFKGNLVGLQWLIVRCMMGGLPLERLKGIVRAKAQKMFARYNWGTAVFTATGLPHLASAVGRKGHLGGLNVPVDGEWGSVCTRPNEMAATLSSPIGMLVSVRSPLVRLRAGAIWLHPDLFDSRKTNMVNLFVIRVTSMCKRFWKETQNLPIYAEAGLAAFLEIDPAAPHATVSALLKMVPPPTEAEGKLKPLDEWPRSLSGLRIGNAIKDRHRAALARVYAEIAILAGLNGSAFHQLLCKLVSRVIPSSGEEGPKYRERSLALIRRAEYMWKARTQVPGNFQYQATCAGASNGLPISCGKGSACTGCVLARTALDNN